VLLAPPVDSAAVAAVAEVATAVEAEEAGTEAVGAVAEVAVVSGLGQTTAGRVVVAVIVEIAVTGAIVGTAASVGGTTTTSGDFRPSGCTSMFVAVRPTHRRPSTSSSCAIDGTLESGSDALSRGQDADGHPSCGVGGNSGFGRASSGQRAAVRG
jgi:hypothetical protein